MQEDEALTRAEQGPSDETLKTLAYAKRLELENERLRTRVKELEHEKIRDSIVKVRTFVFWFGIGICRLWVADASSCQLYRYKTVCKLNCFNSVCGITKEMFEYVLGRLKASNAFRRGASKWYSIEDILVEWCALHLRGASTYDVRSIFLSKIHK